MRILVLSDLWLPFPGGAERLAFNLARDMLRRGNHVEVLTGYEHAQRFDGPQVIAVPIGVGGASGDGWHWIELARASCRPDVILTHHLYARVFGERLVATGIPVVHVVLNGERLPGAALAVFISEWVKERGNPQPGDIVLTPPAFDDVVAETHGDAIGFIKPIPHKGVELVYRIAAAMPERRFVILRGEWQDLEVIRPAPNIEFLEPVDDIRDFYSRCRMVLVPSLSEDAGTVVQEATLNGLPCISTVAGGLAETNGGGIRVGSELVGNWVDLIRSLDNPTFYARTVDRQRAHLAQTDHAGTLDLLAQRIKGLAS